MGVVKGVEERRLGTSAHKSNRHTKLPSMRPQCARATHPLARAHTHTHIWVNAHTYKNQKHTLTAKHFCRPDREEKDKLCECVRKVFDERGVRNRLHRHVCTPNEMQRPVD